MIAQHIISHLRSGPQARLKNLAGLPESAPRKGRERVAGGERSKPLGRAVLNLAPVSAPRKGRERVARGERSEPLGRAVIKEAPEGRKIGIHIKRGKLRDSQGFTLLEVLVALTVFAVGASIMLSLISGSLGNIRKVQLRTRTIEHAEAVMELALLDESIQGPTSFTGDFEDGTRWSVLVEEYISPNAPSLQTDRRQVAMPAKLLNYTIDMFSPNSNTADYRLQTLKLVRATVDNGVMRLP